MKKILVALMLCVASFGFAQESEHMTFMGIPMGCTISQFQAQLAKKNVVVSPDSKKYPTGQRLFTGKFSGKQADMLVWYNERSNLVYRGKALIQCPGKEYSLNVLSEYESKLDVKYGTDTKLEGTFKDDYSHELRSITYVTNNGRIDLFIIGTSYSDSLPFILHIDYHDLKSDTLNTMDEMDDL